MLLLFSLLAFLHPYSELITKQNVFDYIGKLQHIFIHFYSDNCKHCLAVAPEWDELVRMYRPVPGIVMGVVNCDTAQALCVSLEGSSTPTILHFAPRQRNGVAYGGVKDVLHMTKWVRNITSLDPYTKPGSLIFTNPEEVSALTADGSWAFIVVDNPRKQFYNQTEIRKCEDQRSVAFRALSNAQFAVDAARLCKGELNCAVLTDGNEAHEYGGAIDAGSILAFLDDRIPRDL
jgi:thiol-disulfide isomerase/thioredoxin